MDWPISRYPHLSQWFDRVTTRDSYAKALVDWQPGPLIERFRSYSAERRAAGTDVTSFPHFRSPQ